MKHLNGLYYKIASDAPGAPELVLFNALYEATRQLCRKALCWQQTLDDQDVVTGITDYIIEPNVDEEEDPQIHRIVQVVYADSTLDPWEYCMADHETLRLAADPVRDVASGLTVTVALEPANGNGYVPDDLYNRYEECIANGARWLLMKQPKKPWSDPASAEYYRRQFNDDLTAACTEVQRGVGTTAELRVQMRRL